MRGREIISLPVISLETREVLGEVKDLIYDPSGNKVLAFVVEDGGWWKGAKIIIFDQLEQIKSDGVYIPHEQAIIDTNSSEENRNLWQEKACILGYKYINSEGAELGTIEDILVDGETGAVVGYELSNGVIDDLLSGRINVDVPQNFVIDNERVTSLEQETYEI